MAQSLLSGQEEGPARLPRWTMGILNHPTTVAVPGSVLLLADKNKPLGQTSMPQRKSNSSFPLSREEPPAKKTTANGNIILEPQPEESGNDPLNWSAWRRDAALISLGLFCMVGGGMTPILAAGFTNVAEDYKVPISQVSLTTGLFMTGLGIGSVLFSPTAILFGKRPVYLLGSVMFIICSVWCAVSPSFASLIVARIFQGITVSPVECLPSATIAEIFFLHERAFRIGIYTLLLLSGKNLVPLASAIIIQRLGWRWAFYTVAIVVGFCGSLLFLFVPETFWDRHPEPKHKHPHRPSVFRRISSFAAAHKTGSTPEEHKGIHTSEDTTNPTPSSKSVFVRRSTNVECAIADGKNPQPEEDNDRRIENTVRALQHAEPSNFSSGTSHLEKLHGLRTETPKSPGFSNANDEKHGPAAAGAQPHPHAHFAPDIDKELKGKKPSLDLEAGHPQEHDGTLTDMTRNHSSHTSYTDHFRGQPAKSFFQQLRPFNGRLSNDKWWRVAVRPFILFSYPSVLWSALVYSCSIGWLIVISESIALIYRSKDSYNFTALQTGLVYISPFIGGVLGTAVAGKVSDVIVKAMATRNGGLYEPEFRLIMALPIAITTVIGLMGFGWSAQIKDNYMVPTVFFGIVSFGCSLGSTTSITFCLDSYRQYAGEALVTLNFSKNIFHGLVFSLFVTEWVDLDGPKMVYIWIGVIQLITLITTIPMYVFGKRARMWTVEKNFMEKF